MRKKLSLLLAVAACVASMSMPVFAAYTSDLDVSEGDYYSYSVVKENNSDQFYVRPTSYVGTVYGISIPYSTYNDSYPYRPIRNTQNKTGYRYGISTTIGNRYWLKTYGLPDYGWRLQGVYWP